MAGGLKMQPVKHNPALDKYAGKWVAVRGDVVIAHAADSRDLVRRLRAMPDKGKGAVIQRVATSAEPLAIGLG